jgi:hypothetical protein
VSDDGVRIDLLEEDPLTPLARAVAERVDGFHDQLAGCALVLCQPDVMISSGTMSRLVHGASAASVMWIGGAYCDIYSMVLAGLVERVGILHGLRIRTGQFWLPAPQGAKLPWPNHWWGCAWLDHGLVLLDAELGRFYFRRDGQTLATVADLFADPHLADATATEMGDYFRLSKRSDGLVRLVPNYREIRPAADDDKMKRHEPRP